MEFAFIKATDGPLGLDPSFYRNALQAQKAGMRYGFYHFMRPDDVPGQIANLLKVVTPDALETHPLMLDVEVATITLESVEAFVAAFPQSIIYTDRSWITSNVVTAKRVIAPLFLQPLWLAEYGVSTPNPGAMDSVDILAGEDRACPWNLDFG